MIKDAEFYAEEDRRAREAVDVRNQADSLVYSTKKLLNEYREKISANKVRVIEKAIKQTKEAIETNDVTQMRTAIDHLTKASHKISEVMYQQQTQKQADAQPGPEKKDIVEAAFENAN